MSHFTFANQSAIIIGKLSIITFKSLFKKWKSQFQNSQCKTVFSLRAGGQRLLSAFYGQSHIATLDIKFRHKNPSFASKCRHYTVVGGTIDYSIIEGVTCLNLLLLDG